MSCVINHTQLTREQSIKITKDLTFIEKVESFKGKAKKPNIIEMYQVDEATKSVILPFHYAIRELGTFINDKIDYPKANIELIGTPREHQVEVADEMLRDIDRYGSTTLALYPAFGKTFMGALLASMMKLKVVVVVSCVILLKQWKKTFDTVTKCKSMIVDRKTKVVDETCDVFICMNQQLKKLESVRKNIGLVVFDEAHLLCTKTNIPTWLFFSPKGILVETATPKRTDGLESMAQSVAGDHFIFRPRPDRFSVIRIKTNICFNKVIEGQNGYETITYHQAMFNLINNIERNVIIVKILNRLVEQGHKVLVLGKRKDHCDLIKDMMREMYPEVRIDSLYGVKKSYTDGDILVGTIPKIGTGFDQESSCDDYDGNRFDTLCLLDYITKENTLIQTTGRVSRCDNPTIIQFFDKYSGFTKTWNLNCNYYNSIGAVIEDVDWNKIKQHY